MLRLPHVHIMENLFPTLFLFLFFFPHPPTCVQFVIFSSMALDVFSLLQVNASAVWPGLRAAAAATRCPFRIKMLMRMLQVHEAVNLTASRHVKVISLSH
jgi:hypothetical protein